MSMTRILASRYVHRSPAPRWGQEGFGGLATRVEAPGHTRAAASPKVAGAAEAAALAIGPSTMSRRTFAGLGAALAAGALAASPLAGAFAPLADASEDPTASETPAAGPADATGSPAPSPVDDFYEAVNHDTLASWEIPAGEGRISVITNLRDNVRAVVDDLVRDAAAHPDTDDPDLHAIGALYATGMDAETRAAGGFGAIAESCLRAIDQASTPTELVTQLLDAALQTRAASLLNIGVGRHPLDASKRCLSLWIPDVGPGREILLSQDATLQKVGEAYESLVARLWELLGIESGEAKRIAADVVELLREVAPSVLSAAEQYDPSMATNLLTVSELSELLGGALDVEHFCKTTGLAATDELDVANPEALRAFAAHLNADGLPLLKRYVQTALLVDLAPYADPQAAAAKMDYQVLKDGLSEAPESERNLLNLIEEALASFQCSRPFCAASFPETAKRDVKDMAAEITGVFARRIETLGWMSEATKERAYRKLDKLAVRSGYPDAWPQDAYADDMLELQFPEEGGLFIDNAVRLLAAELRGELALLTDESRELPWSLSPITVNAFYDPSTNSITILAGILQAPLYDVKAPREQNLGSIGAIIAHEISHAFDNNGAQYDEQGNVSNWWEEADYAHFQKLGEKAAAYYDGFSVDGRQVDGALTLSENIADLGGVACVTQIGVEEGLDLGALFESWARVWATKCTDEWLTNQVATDVHSPAKTRVNAVLGAIDEFYETYGVTEGDGMWRAPEERPRIW